MKKITGTKLIIAGVALMLTLPAIILMFAALLFKDLSAGAGLALFYFSGGICAEMIVFGVALKRWENEEEEKIFKRARGEKVEEGGKKNIFKMLSPAQIALSCAIMVWPFTMLFVENEGSPLFGILAIVFFISMMAAVVLFIAGLVKGIVKERKRSESFAAKAAELKAKKPGATLSGGNMGTVRGGPAGSSPGAVPPRPQSSRQVQHCDFCGTTLGIEATYIIVDGKRLCPPCSAMVERLKKEEAEKKEAPKSPCSVCGTALPERDMYLVNSGFYCEECFNKKFGE